MLTVVLPKSKQKVLRWESVEILELIFATVRLDQFLRELPVELELDAQVEPIPMVW